MGRTTSLALLILLGGVLSSGCLIAHSTNVEVRGKTVSPEFEDQIREGETTAAWVVAALGEPTRRKSVNGGEILSYRSTVTKERDSGVFLLFSGEKSVTKDVTKFFEFHEGVLIRYWTN